MSPTDEIRSILKRVWGYDAFRPMQEDIILSVLSGNDTLALLPTGGGKSLCYQVPALAKPGLCIVVSPLISLMKDQVFQLLKRNIKCGALYSGQSQREMDVVVNNCATGAFKFLYLSPERLAGVRFREILAHLPVNLLAVDESHCISQWGYDFRPEYLKIAEVRKDLAGVPVLAVTATATPEVARDITEKLEFNNGHSYKKSFVRPNLHYIVQHEQDKLHRLENIIKKIGGTGVVYVRSRRRTEEFAKWLQARGYSASAYHAGLKFDKREEIQKNWTIGGLQLVVATNAFGMGIDKPDVRWVVHLDIPDNPEAYFQEAGRGGRDEKKAYAVLLYDEADLFELTERSKKSFPENAYVQRVYKALGNYLGVATGSGEGCDFGFDISEFSKNFSFKPAEVLPALKLMEVEGWLRLSDAFHDPSRVAVLLNRREIYAQQVKNDADSELLITLLRSYPGVMSQFVIIDEKLIAKRSKTEVKDVIKVLLNYHKMGWVEYLPATDTPRITWLCDRMEDKNVNLTEARTGQLRLRAQMRMEAMRSYVLEVGCRSKILVSYFGEENAIECGSCDYCMGRKKPPAPPARRMKEIKDVLKEGPKHEAEIVTLLGKTGALQIAQAISWMLDTGELKLQKGRIYLVNSNN